MDFSGRKNPEQKSSGTLSWGSRVWDFRVVKEPHAWKNRLWAKLNRHIHVLIPKFGERNRSWEGRSALGSNDHPINTIQYNNKINTIDWYIGNLVEVRCYGRLWTDIRYHYQETVILRDVNWSLAWLPRSKSLGVSVNL